ncbi:hypothetical protein EZV62_006136 [Acer yangbiense]|uniref:At4g15545-like C-terminal domain-containing protein n=1 Tax=Acer yangbiense TaxID=1000413 RepID=A0A5C7IPJ0_9ROSI|nr:hypothetical protein EZV62_006136 [Acer yangbiense]
MLVSLKSSFSQWHFIKHVQCIRFRTVSAIANLNPVSSDSDVDGPNVNSKCELQGNGFSLELSTNEVLETLNGLRKKPKEALSYFLKLETNGFSHDVYTYAAIVRILCHCCWDRRLDSMMLELVRKENELDFEVTDLFEALSDEGSNALVRLCDALVKAYVSVGMFDEAIDVLFQIKRRGFALSILSCNFFMNRLIECGKVDMALAFYQQLKRLGLSSNEYTYVLVIKALCRKGCLEEAVEVFREADEAGVTLNSFAYSTYIEGLCNNGRLDLGYQMLQAWQAADVPLGVFVYSFVIHRFCNENRLEEAENLLRGMEKHGVLPDVNVYSALIHGNCKFGSIMKALDLMDEMESKGIKTNCVIVSYILKCLCRKDLAETVDRFMKLKDTRVYLDKVCYNIAMEALCKLGKVEVAVELFNEMKNKQMAIDVVNYTTVIYGYCLQGKILEAFNLFLEMKGTGHEPDLVTYNILAGEFARRGLEQEVYCLLDDMKTQCLKPDAVVHKMIIEGFCIGGKVKEAEAFLDSLQEKCLENYSAMFDGYCKAKHLTRAFELFMNLSKQGILTVNGCKQHNNFYMEGDKEKAVMLLETMISKLIGRFCQAGETEKARMVFNVLTGIGFTPDLYTYTMMINAYCKKSRLHEARDLFNDMKQRGIKPDVVTYTVLFNAHSKIDLERSYSPPNALQSEEKVVDASVFLSEMEEMDIRPDLFCYTALLVRYCKTKNLEDAVEVFNEMTLIGLEPDIVTYRALFSCYCVTGDVDSAKIILDEMLAKEIKPDKHTLASFYRALKALDLQRLIRTVSRLCAPLAVSALKQAETVDIGTCDQSVPKAYPDKDEGTNGYIGQRYHNGSTDMDEASRNAGRRFSLTPYFTPRLTPTGTPKIISTSGSPRGYSTAEAPQKTSGATSSTKSLYDGQTSLSSWYPSSRQSSEGALLELMERSSSVKPGVAYHMNNSVQFLATIKDLNAQKQTREETLKKAEEIFGTDNKDLYAYFQGLLNRNMH